MRTRRESLRKALDPLFQARQRVAQLGDSARVPGLLLAAHQDSRFLGEKVRGRARDAARHVGACHLAKLRLRRRCDARPRRRRRATAPPRRPSAGAVRARRSPAARRALPLLSSARRNSSSPRGQRDQRSRSDLQGEGRESRRPPRGGRPEDGGRSGGTETAAAQLDGLAGKRASRSRAHGSASSRWFVNKRPPRGRHLFTGQRVPQCICWMPARSQPLEPSAGLTRFHTSSNSTGRLFGASRTAPENRTLTQWASCPRWRSSTRSASSDQTSVCWPSAARVEHVLAQLVEHLVGREFADLVELALVVGELQLHEVQLRRAQERRCVEARRHGRAARTSPRRSAAAAPWSSDHARVRMGCGRARRRHAEESTARRAEKQDAGERTLQRDPASRRARAAAASASSARAPRVAACGGPGRGPAVLLRGPAGRRRCLGTRSLHAAAARAAQACGIGILRGEQPHRPRAANPFRISLVLLQIHAIKFVPASGRPPPRRRD